MRSMTLACMSLFMALITGCSDDSTSPGEGATDPPGDEVLAEGVVGVDGGEVSSGSVSVVVPGGAFAGDATLRVVLVADPEPPDGGTPAVPVYRIEGLPQSWESDLTLRYRWNADAPVDGVALGEPVWAPSAGEQVVAWRSAGLAIDDSTTWVDIPLSSPPVGDGRDPRLLRRRDDLHVLISGEQARDNLVSSGGHFQLFWNRYRSVQPADAQALAGYLEEAYTHFLDLGFSYAPRQAWPMRVEIRAVHRSSVYGLFEPSAFGHDHAFLSFNEALIAEREEMRVSAGHEFFHAVQAYYDPRSAYDRASSGGAHYWLDEAMSTWSEASFSDDAEFASAARQANRHLPFEGAGKGLETVDPQNYGYGMAGVIGWMVGQVHTERPVAVYQRILAGDAPFAALSSVIGSEPGSWWTSFLTAYVSGDAIGDVTPDWLFGHRHDELRITGDDFAPTTITESIGHLGGRIYFVRLEFPGIEPLALLRARLETPGGELVVLRWHAGQVPVVIDGGDGVVTVDSLRAETDAHNHLIVLVTNPDGDAPSYAGERPIATAFEVETPSDMSGFETGSVRLNFHAWYRSADGVGPGNPGEQYAATNTSGTWIGDTYRGAWDDTGVGYRNWGEIVIQIDAVDRSVRGWSVHGQNTLTSGESSLHEETRFSGGAVPTISLGDNRQFSQVVGSVTGGSVDEIYYRKTINGELDRELDHWECDGLSWLEIRISDDLP